MHVQLSRYAVAAWLPCLVATVIALSAISHCIMPRLRRATPVIVPARHLDFRLRVIPSPAWYRQGMNKLSAVPARRHAANRSRA
jgi:hypothetical protein